MNGEKGEGIEERKEDERGERMEEKVRGSEIERR